MSQVARLVPCREMTTTTFAAHPLVSDYFNGFVSECYALACGPAHPSGTMRCRIGRLHV